jgi:hypothetical protein
LIGRLERTAGRDGNQRQPEQALLLVNYPDFGAVRGHGQCRLVAIRDDPILSLHLPITQEQLHLVKGNGQP